MIVRTALPWEVDAVLAFWRLAAEDAHRPADTADAVLALVGRDPEALILALEDDEILGTIVAGWDGWRAHLYRLAVHPARRRTGIARVLLDAAASRLGALGATRIDAMVLDDNLEAHAFWSAAGFTPQAEWRRWVVPVAP